MTTEPLLPDAKRLELIGEAVLYCQRVAALGMPASCYTKALREPILFLWEKRKGPKSAIPRYRSKASAGLERGNGDLIYDHAIPFRLLQKELLDLKHVAPQALADTLNRYEMVVLITKAENARLNAMGLARAMPSDWDGSDPLARYAAAHIHLVPNVP